MRCDKCGAYTSRSADACRKCGTVLRNLRLPAKRPPSQPPALWRQAAPVLAQGAALLALGVAAEMAITALAKGALRLPSLRQKKGLPATRNGKSAQATLAVSETVVMRRTIVQR